MDSYSSRAKIYWLQSIVHIVAVPVEYLRVDGAFARVRSAFRDAFRHFLRISCLTLPPFAFIPKGFQPLAPGREAHTGNADRSSLLPPPANPQKADWRVVEEIDFQCFPVVALRLPPANGFNLFEVRGGVYRGVSFSDAFLLPLRRVTDQDLPTKLLKTPCYEPVSW